MAAREELAVLSLSRTLHHVAHSCHLAVALFLTAILAENNGTSARTGCRHFCRKRHMRSARRVARRSLPDILTWPPCQLTILPRPKLNSIGVVFLQGRAGVPSSHIGTF